ncbi:sigma factor G inhibitor Gin [Paenibacillus septentrionalis]|uniref:Sigma factor G inhibitor Gin n=1 Tax=Paenibacillus septentrionalis TaxID=429342 RepID=A0ABW1VAW8_9BACL
MNTTDQQCTICGKESEIGLHIVSSFICSSCEQEIVQIDVEDERYPFFVSRMKTILYEPNANA